MANDKQTKSVDEASGNAHDDAAADAELAAMAELASAPLREAQSKRKAKDGSKPAKAKAKPKTTEESVTLPIERTVKAFVKGISPSIEDMPPLSEDDDGISLDAALDDFMLDAKKVSTALPPPVVDDKQLADLARVPVMTVEPTPVLPDEERKGTSLGNLLLAAGLGAALAVGAVTLMRSSNRTTVPSTPVQPPAAKAATTSTPTAAKLPAAAAPVMTPDAAATPAPTAATSGPDAAPTAATSGPDAAPATAAKVAATTPDAAPAPKAASTAPDAGPAKATPKVAAKKKSSTPKKKVARRKSKRAAKKSVKTPKKRAKKKRTKKKKKKKAAGGDWVDPFSR